MVCLVKMVSIDLCAANEPRVTNGIPDHVGANLLRGFIDGATINKTSDAYSITNRESRCHNAMFLYGVTLFNRAIVEIWCLAR